jgi:hypothetical protein
MSGVAKIEPLPGFLGMVSDLQERVDAIGEGDVPNEWTPEHVGVRLIEAFEILRRSGGRVGPRQHANGWPAMVHEFADLVDAQARMLAEKEKAHARAVRPTADEVSRMNEALRWPMAYLRGRPLAADALMIWAYAHAAGRELEPLLHRRKKRAVALAEEMMRRINAEPHGSGEDGAGDCRSMAMQWRAALRRQVAREITDWANERLARVKPEHRDKVRTEAQEMLKDRCKALNCLPVQVKPREAMPGRVLIPMTASRQRKIAMEIVAKALRRAGVAVR